MARLLILLPTDGKVHTRFMTSFVSLTQALNRRGIAFAIKNYEFSDIVVSRNYLVSYFLSHKDFTHALFLDGDLVFKAGQFFRLWDFNKDFVAAPYPDRRVTGPVLLKAARAAGDLDALDGGKLQELLAQNMRYVVTYDPGVGRDYPRKTEGDFFTVASAGTGFMLITRRVVEEIVENGMAYPYPRTGRLNIYRDAPLFADFFSHHTTPDGNAFYGEDQSFCHRWIFGCGGDVWVDRASKVSHIGEFTYYGDYSVASGLQGER